MQLKTDRTTPQDPASCPPAAGQDAWRAEIAELLKAAGYRFVAADPGDPVAVVGAGLPGLATWTIGVVINPALRELGQVLNHAFGVVGCGAVLLVCRSLRERASIAASLGRIMRPEWRDRIGLAGIDTLRLRFGRAPGPVRHHR